MSNENKVTYTKLTDKNGNPPSEKYQKKINHT